MLSIAPSNTQALTIGEVVENYGVTFDQLRYWDRIGICVPIRIGNQRVYERPHLEQLAWVQRQMSEGMSPAEIKIYLRQNKIEPPPSHPSTRALETAIRGARRGDVIRDPLPSKEQYNTGWRRLERIVKRVFPQKSVGRGRDVEIGLSEDERFMEIRFLK